MKKGRERVIKIEENCQKQTNMKAVTCVFSVDLKKEKEVN